MIASERSVNAPIIYGFLGGVKYYKGVSVGTQNPFGAELIEDALEFISSDDKLANFRKLTFNQNLSESVSWRPFTRLAI
jgi:hypothetical protein